MRGFYLNQRPIPDLRESQPGLGIIWELRLMKYSGLIRDNNLLSRQLEKAVTRTLGEDLRSSGFSALPVTQLRGL